MGRNNGRNKIAKSRKNQNARREGNLQIVEDIGSGHHQRSKDEIKDNKRIPQKNEKIS